MSRHDIGVTPYGVMPASSSFSTAPMLFEPALYHDEGPAFFGTLVLQPGKRPKHQGYPVAVLPDWLHAVQGSKLDTYITQAQLMRPRRLIANVRSIGLVWADCGDDGQLSKHGDAAAVGWMLRAIDDAGLPVPSLIVASGRGYHVKWLFDGQLALEELPRWNAVERALNEALRGDLGADMSATDAARVLRVVGTENSRTGTVARIVWRNDVNGSPLRYDFETLAFEVLPKPIEIASGKPTKTRRQATGFQTYTIATLWWGRYHDLRRLCAMRGWSRSRGGVPVGYRDLVLFLFSVALSWVALPERWLQEIEAIGEEYTPTLKAMERRTYVGTVYKKLVASRMPGRKDERYRYSTARLVLDLGISHEEMRNLKYLVAPEIMRERKLERYSAYSAQRRAPESEAIKIKRAIRNEKIRRMAAEGRSLRDIAKEVGCSPQTAMRALAEPTAG